DRINVLVFEDPPHVRIDLRPLARGLEYHPGLFLGPTPVRIHKGRDLNVRDRQNLFYVGGPARSDPHDGDSNTIVGGGPTLRSGRSGRKEKVTTFHRSREGCSIPSLY